MKLLHSTPRLTRRLGAALVAVCLAAIPLSSFAGVFVSVGIAPPPLPYYAQPEIPGPGYIWTPGYWDYADGDYYWVPGTWVQAPYEGALWTPGYWGWGDGFYVFHGGYWGRHVGFYGGINYGYGYGGRGYEGGYWNHGSFNYNRSVNNINNVHITNVYNKTVINNPGGNRASFNGGRGGVGARPTAQEQAFGREQHTQPVAAQQQQVHMASQNTALRASVNHGTPAIGATPRAGDFGGHVSAAQAGPVNAAAGHANAPGAQGATNALHSASFAPAAARGAAATVPGGAAASHTAGAAASNPNALRSASFAPGHQAAAQAGGAQPNRAAVTQANRAEPASHASRPAGGNIQPRQSAPTHQQAPHEQAQMRQASPQHQQQAAHAAPRQAPANHQGGGNHGGGHDDHGK
jgi:WXXGXW repeat (2 copies)